MKKGSLFGLIIVIIIFSIIFIPKISDRILNNKTVSSSRTFDIEKTLVYIIDKEGNLRGRDDDEDNLNGRMFGYNSSSVAEINNKMVDDVKVILAEYRLALKKNNSFRIK
jgi:hypothetical protein